MSSPKPLGVFWHLNQSYFADNLCPNEVITRLRRYVSNKFNYNAIEYQFSCVFNQKISDNVIQSFLENRCDILHIDSDYDLIVSLNQIIEKFVSAFGFDSIVVIISDNSYLSSSIRLVQHREVSVLLIYGRNSSQELIHSANDSISFDEIFNCDHIVILWVTNFPTDRSRNSIRHTFQPLCRFFKCRFRFAKKDLLRLEFNNLIDAQSAAIELMAKDLFTQKLSVDIEIPPERPDPFSSDLSSDPFSSSPDSERLCLRPCVDPQHDDQCKSVIIGLHTHTGQNVLRMVRDLVNSWNDFAITGDMILRVNRERDFKHRDGKASLIVTATDRRSNSRLISVAKKNFVDRDKKLFWNRLKRPRKDSNKMSDFEDVGPECRSIVIGLWTKEDENVLTTVRNLVKSWDIAGFNLKSIVNVERSRKFSGRDGKAALIVSADSVESHQSLLTFAANKFIDKSQKFYWRPFQTERSVDGMRLHRPRVSPKRDSIFWNQNIFGQTYY